MLKDQISTYTGDKAHMDKLLGYAGSEIIQQLTYETNITMTTPIEGSLKSVSIVITFMNANMGTIIAFLAILSTQLIYSLMLSDVEDKTYEFGMLRALGFNTNNVMITILC